MQCLTSLFRNDYDNLRVIIADNASTDDSIESIRRDFPQVQIINLTANLGYAGNNNVGIRAALEQGAEWIFLLNDDTVLDPSCLSTLIEVGESDGKIGIVGPMVYHYDEPQIIQSAGGVLGTNWLSIHVGQNELDCGQFKSVRDVEWISGCAILIRRAVIDQVGMMDTDYFLYWEETEWCIRIKKAGWRIVHVPHAKLWHKGVQRNYQPKPYVTYYSTRNRLLTLAKHQAPWPVRFLAFIQIIRTLISWSVKYRSPSVREHRSAMWKGLMDFLQNRLGPMLS